MRRFAEAVASHDKALAINPNYAEAFLSRAAALRDLGRFEEALSSCDAAIAKGADSAEAFNIPRHAVMAPENASTPRWTVTIWRSPSSRAPPRSRTTAAWP